MDTIAATSSSLASPPRAATVQVIERMMSLIDALAAERKSVSLKNLSLTTGLHPSTAHRILNDMVLSRFVDRTEPGRYRLGMRLLELGNIVRSRLSVREAALEPMRALHRSTGQTVTLAVRQGDDIVSVERNADDLSGVHVVRTSGTRAPLHLTAIGKLFLASEDPRQVRGYATRTGLPGKTSSSITEITTLERDLSQVRARGYARDDEELENGVRSIAAAIHDDNGRLVAGLALTAPADRFDERWVQPLRAAAASISAAVGAN